MAEFDPNLVYYVARVRGMRSHLYSRSAVEEFLSQNNLQRMIDTLLESPYRAEMAEAVTRFSGADAVEEGTSRNLMNTFHNLLIRARGEFKEYVRIFLTRWDLAAAKSLLRCRHQGISGEQAGNALIPGPTLTAPLLKDFAQLESMEALVNALYRWDSQLCRDLVKALPQYQEHGDVSILEEALDERYFYRNMKTLAGDENPNAAAVRDYLRSEIDRINLRLLFQRFQQRGQRDGVRRGFIPNGFLSSAKMETMVAANDAASAMEQLANTRYADLTEELFRYMQTGLFSPIERYFERLIVRELLHTARLNVFSLAVMMSYTWLKYNEIVNFRLIARGLAGHLPKGRVQEELFFVA